MRPIPDMKNVDVAFGNIAHLPNWKEIPEEFKQYGNKYCHVISHWFFCGLTENQMALLKPKAGVDTKKALIAIKAILGSFAPKHEHKEAGCAYLLSEWFDLSDDDVKKFGGRLP